MCVCVCVCAILLTQRHVINLPPFLQIPSGVRGYVLSFCSGMIGQVRQPILAQVSVHEPLQVYERAAACRCEDECAGVRVAGVRVCCVRMNVLE